MIATLGQHTASKNPTLSTTGELLPVFWINIVAGLAVIAFGTSKLKPEQEDKEKIEAVPPMVVLGESKCWAAEALQRLSRNVKP
jgi:hypothetical protein